MKKVFVDTNILVDLLSMRAPFYDDSVKLFSLADKKKIELSISSLTIANTNYILTKQLGKFQSKAILKKIALVVQILPLNSKVIDLALIDETFSDYEDGLQYFTAIEHQQDVIVTRNLKDYKNASITVMTPRQFVEYFLNS
ncbi:MAG: type II toxin-antitoxin system VapC family toxin [Flavobacterium sp.]